MNTNLDEAWFLCKNDKICQHMAYSSVSANALSRGKFTSHIYDLNLIQSHLFFFFVKWVEYNYLISHKNTSNSGAK